MKARDQDGFLGEVQAAKDRLRLPKDAPVKSCYEAGRDGFWIHRFLEGNGIVNVIVDPASIEVNRRSKHVKIDRLDAQKLAQLLVRHHDGEDVLRVVRVPPLNVEIERLLPPQVKVLKKKRTQVSNRIRGELFLHGVDLDPRKGDLHKRTFLDDLERARQWDGSPLPAGLVYMVQLDYEHFCLLEDQLRDLAARQRRALKKAREGSADVTVAQRKAALLRQQLEGLEDLLEPPKPWLRVLGHTTSDLGTLHCQHPNSMGARF